MPKSTPAGRVAAVVLACIAMCAPIDAARVLKGAVDGGPAGRLAATRSLLGAMKSQVGGRPTSWETDPHHQNEVDVAQAVPKATVPGTDVYMINTLPRTGGREGGVFSNNIQSSVMMGSTYDHVGTAARTRIVANADVNVRSALGTMDQQAIVQRAAGATDASDMWRAARDAHGAAVVTNRGVGKEIRDSSNRSTMAMKDTSAAIQMVAGGSGVDQHFATRVGAATANGVGHSQTHMYTMVPTWWRR